MCWSFVLVYDVVCDGGFFLFEGFFMFFCLYMMFGDELYVVWYVCVLVVLLLSCLCCLLFDDVYFIQQCFIECCVEYGEVVVGKKIGVMSQVVQDMFNVCQFDFGILLFGMYYVVGEVIVIDLLIVLCVEGEIVFIFVYDLCGFGIDCIDVIVVMVVVVFCFEIVDLCICDWVIWIEDIVVDNVLCGVYVFGDVCVDLCMFDFVVCEMMIEKNGEFVVCGCGDVVFGYFVDVVVWFVNMFVVYDVLLFVGEIVLFGLFMKLILVMVGDMLLMYIVGIGGCDVCFI